MSEATICDSCRETATEGLTEMQKQGWFKVQGRSTDGTEIISHVCSYECLGTLALDLGALSY